MDAAAVKNIKPLYAEDPTMFDACKAWQNGEVYLEMAYNAYYTNYEIALINTWFIGVGGRELPACGSCAVGSGVCASICVCTLPSTLSASRPARQLSRRLWI